MGDPQTKINSKDVAREALRALVVRKLDPTPDNYRKLFNEIAGLPPEPDSAGAEELVGRIVADFPRGSPELLRLAKALERAHAKRDWNQYAALFQESASAIEQYQRSTDTWRQLITDVLHQLDVGHKGVTRARKKERIERMLEMPSSTPEQLQQKLTAIVKSWSELPLGTIGVESVEREAVIAQNDPVMALPADRGAMPPAAPEPSEIKASCALIGQIMEIGFARLLGYDASLVAEAENLGRQAHAVRSAGEFATLSSAIKSYLLKIELDAVNATDLQQAMLRLLRLVIDNVGQLVGEDDWLHGQINALSEIISQPLDMVMIEHAERSMKDAVLRQGSLRHSLTEAKSAFKSMVSGFVNRLGEFSESTGDYHDKIASLSGQIRETDDIEALGRLLDQVAQATKDVQSATQRSREETLATQREVQAAEDKIRVLQAELARVSSKVKEDQLTGALNRRGLEEEYERSCSASERRKEPMSMALLDIDNFKSLNDTHGHQAGDGALVHLAKVIKATVRPTDVVCRYGGEEFVVLLPGTSLNDSIAVISRLQRELTKRFFLHDNQRLLLTFSAGVAERKSGETREQTIGRADAAMYCAKRTGKNRVVPAA